MLSRNYFLDLLFLRFTRLVFLFVERDDFFPLLLRRAEINEEYRDPPTATPLPVFGSSTFGTCGLKFRGDETSIVSKTTPFGGLPFFESTTGSSLLLLTAYSAFVLLRMDVASGENSGSSSDKDSPSSDEDSSSSS